MNEETTGCMQEEGGEDAGREPRTREVENRRRRHGTEDLITGRLRIVGGGGLYRCR